MRIVSDQHSLDPAVRRPDPSHADIEIQTSSSRLSSTASANPPPPPSPDTRPPALHRPGVPVPRVRRACAAPETRSPKSQIAPRAEFPQRPTLPVSRGSTSPRPAPRASGPEGTRPARVRRALGDTCSHLPNSQILAFPQNAQISQIPSHPKTKSADPIPDTHLQGQSAIKPGIFPTFRPNVAQASLNEERYPNDMSLNDASNPRSTTCRINVANRPAHSGTHSATPTQTQTYLLRYAAPLATNTADMSLNHRSNPTHQAAHVQVCRTEHVLRHHRTDQTAPPIRSNSPHRAYLPVPIDPHHYTHHTQSTHKPTRPSPIA